MGERRGAYRLREGDSGIYRRIILEWIVKKWDGEGAWSGSG